MQKMIKPFAISALCLAVSGQSIAGNDEKIEANPWSNFSLQNTLNSMPKGNVERGVKIHQQMMCNACHGATGESPSRNYASINGQPEAYIIKNMLDYQDGRRWESFKQANIMVKISRALDKQQIADLAAFYAKQPISAKTAYLTDTSGKEVDKLVRHGDANRMIVPCASCHGAKGEGNGIVPALAGQVPEYFIRTMKAYQNGQRHNDVNKGMSMFTHQISDGDIEKLAHYYANLPQNKEAK